MPVLDRLVSISTGLVSEPALCLGAGAAEISQETLYVYERPSHNDHHSHNDKDALDDHVCKNPHQRNGHASKSKESVQY